MSFLDSSKYFFNKLTHFEISFKTGKSEARHILQYNDSTVIAKTFKPTQENRKFTTLIILNLSSSEIEPRRVR